MRIEVAEKGNKLLIKNLSNKNTVSIFYDEEKSYFKNILGLFPNYGVVDFETRKDRDIFEIKELK